MGPIRTAKFWRTVGGLLLLAAISFASTYLCSRRALAKGVETGTPFTAQMTKSYYSGNGTLVRRTTKIYARYGNRKTAYEVTEVYPKQTPKLIDIVDVPAGEEIVLDPVTKSKSTFYYTPDHLRRIFLESSSESCPSNVSDLEQAGIFFGYPTRHEIDHLSPTWTEEAWLIPELNCLAVKQIDYLSANGKVAARNEEVVTSLVMGDPAPDVLPNPDDYTEMTPEDMENEVARLYPGQVFWGPTMLKRMEKEYQARRQPYDQQ